MRTRFFFATLQIGREDEHSLSDTRSIFSKSLCPEGRFNYNRVTKMSCFSIGGSLYSFSDAGGVGMSDNEWYIANDSLSGSCIVAGEITKYNLVFHDSNGKEILKVDEDGFTYKGQHIEDGGEAWEAFIDACKRAGL